MIVQLRFAGVDVVKINGVLARERMLLVWIVLMKEWHLL
jgi:hypothetical protein